MATVLTEIISEEKYNSLDFRIQVLLKNLLSNMEKLDNVELRYVNNNASVDFVVFNKLDKRPILVIEVDGFEFHENNPKQLSRDELKNGILRKYNMPLMRLATNGSGEKAKLRNKLDELM